MGKTGPEKPVGDVYVAGGKYRLVTTIGNGSFGDIYRAVSVCTGEEVAVKLEPRTAKHPQLKHEANLYK